MDLSNHVYRFNITWNLIASRSNSDKSLKMLSMVAENCSLSMAVGRSLFMSCLKSYNRNNVPALTFIIYIYVNYSGRDKKTI